METILNHEANQRAALTGDHLRLVIDTIPGFDWSASPDGAIEFLNQRGLDYRGFSIDVEIDARKNAEDLLAGEKRLLEMMARGDSLASVLEALCGIVEKNAGGSL